MSECPPPEQLMAFAKGNLSKDDFESLAAHVEQCPACDALLEKFEASEDNLVSQLHNIQKSQKDLPEEVLDAAISVAADGHRRGTIDPGKAYAEKLAEGDLQISKFRLQKKLGDGSFGAVFLAHDTELDRKVAVKISRAGSLSNDQEIHTFLREARAAAQLSHPQIVSIYDSGQTAEGVCYIVSEYIEGDTLEDQLAS